MNQTLEGYRLSRQQKYLWQLQQEFPRLAQAECVVTIDGRVSAALLRESLERVVNRHQILRTRYERLSGMDVPLQVVGEERGAVDWSTDDGEALVHATLARDAEEKYTLRIRLSALSADASTFAIVVEEIAREYERLTSGDAEFEDDVLQYVQFSEWQLQLVDDEANEEGQRFWRSVVARELAAPGLPFEKNSGRSFESSFISFTPGADTTTAIFSLAKQWDVSFAVFLQACWHAWLWRVGKQKEFCVHTFFDGRKYDDLKKVPGLMAHYLPLYTHIEDEYKFNELVHLLEEARHKALEWEEYFDAEMTEASSEAAVQFAFEQAPGPITAAQLTFTIREQRSNGEPYKIKLSTLQRDNELSFELHYDTSIYQRDAIETFAKQMLALLESAVAHPEAKLTSLDLMTETDKRQVLIDFNQTEAPYPSDQCVQQVFEQQVELTPDAIAVVYENQQLTYRELNARANRIAHQLRGLGAGPEVVVALYINRSVELIVGLLGILKSGAAYLPIDLNQPEHRLRFILDDAAAPIVVTQTGVDAGWVDANVLVVHIDEHDASQSDANPSVQTSPDNLAYLIYTSGSAGQPKAVMIRHRSVLNLVTGLCQSVYQQQTAPMRVSVNAPLAFDGSVKQWVQLLSGHAIDIVPEDIRPDGEQLLSYLDQQLVDVLDCTPAQLRLLLQAGLTEKKDSSVKMLLVGGEAFEESAWTIFSNSTSIACFNVYGPTECTVDATSCRVEAPIATPAIGRPLANVQSYLLDSDLRPVPAGVNGELWISGEGLARGYLKRADLTAEKFIPHPYSRNTGARLYRTGDVARHRPGGQIEFAGRSDYQVKLRGYRVELGEIESSLAQHPSVRTAVVTLRGAEGEDHRLVAYVVPRIYSEPQMVTAMELKMFLRERLPEYMIPSVVMLTDTLPLTRNGKVDRAALPAPDSDADADRDLNPPSNVFEEVLANIWGDVLGVKRVGVEENFFELGGHSLLATQLISRVRNAFHLELPLRAVFERPTIAGLAQTIADRINGEHSTAYPPIEPVAREGKLPLSFAQHRLWFLNQLEPDSPFYNLRHHLLLQGKLDVSALERTFSEIVRRHETLRTSFVEIEGNPVQVIADAQPVRLDVIDLSHFDPDERWSRLQSCAQEEVRQPFDLSQAPLMRVKLLRLADDEHALLYTMHHLISDGWSSSVLMSEVVALYTAFINNEPSPLTDLPIQYADFAIWQRRCLEGAGLEVHLDYWRRQLADAPAELALPTTRSRPRVQTFRSETLPLSFSESTTEALKALSRREGTTLYMTLLAAFQTLLYRYTGQEDIIVGSPVANRNRQEIEHLIGFFINTLVLRTNLQGNPGFSELMRRVRDVTLEAYAHQDLPFEKLLQEIQVRRDLSRTPLFQVLMVFQNVPRKAEGLPGLTATEIVTGGRWSNFDLTLWASEGPQGLAGVLEYNTDLFDAATIQRMIEHFYSLVESALANPSQPISSLQIAGDSERNLLLHEWNDTHADYPSQTSFIELFEERVAATPDAMAVADEREQLTYEELNRRANRLAHKLVKAGVGIDGLAGVMAERGAGFLTAMLGIFKAGGAYMPLDPRSPAARQRQVLEQSGARWVLVQAAKLSLIEQSLALFTDREQPQVLVLDDLPASDEDVENPRVERSPGQLAYVIYTSGSTGVPKGAMIEQRGMLNHLYAKIADLQIQESDVVAQTASQCFDISVWQYLVALLTGGRVEIFDDGIAMDGTRLLDAAARRGVTILETVPSLLRVMVEAKGSTENLKWLLLTGEALPPQLCREWFELHKDVRLLNAYGPTECSDDVTHYEIAEAPAEEIARMPIGGAVGNMQGYVVDRFQQLAPVGVFGELLVGGEGVGRGYLNDPARTAEVFIPHSYGAPEGARLYRTGDVVRWLDGGVLEYIGRLDHQVKVRGNRIELGEIEAALSKHPEVRDNVVDTRIDEDGSRLIVAYVVLDESSNLAELRNYLKEQLPDYMVPSVFMPMERLPLTPNGKIDRRALPAPSRDELVRVLDYVAPRDEVEEELARIWSEVLRVEKVGVIDDFFELGGHSLLATQVVSRIRSAFQIELPLRTLFEQTTIASLAAALSQMQLEEQAREDAELLAQLEQFSEEQVEAMLSEMSIERTGQYSPGSLLP